VETGVYYPRPVFEYACFSELPNVVPGDVPETRRLANECLSLPVHPGVTAPQIEHIVQSTRSALDA
jgi:dTDP-4-amino-4,6-dideoxygalactose transaminase